MCKFKVNVKNLRWEENLLTGICGTLDTLGGKEELMQIDCEVTQVYNLDRRNQRRGRKVPK